MIKIYYNLTEPGIIYGNAMTAAAGFFLASKGVINFLLLVETLLAVSLIIASGCVFNNLIDKNLDEKMTRTKKRALPAGLVSPVNAVIYATVLALLGFGLLIAYTNLLTLVIGVIAYLCYIILYGISKRSSVHGTLVGSVAGAAPIVAGYTAVTNRFDTAALLLFLILVFWQMPHFYAIAMYRLKDYKEAGLPVLPIVKGMRATKIQILLYTFAFVLACLALYFFGYTGLTYLLVISILGGIWIWRGVSSFKISNDNQWARKMFLFSLVVLLCFSVTLYIQAFLP